MRNSSYSLSHDNLTSRCSWLLFAALLIAVSFFVSSLAEKNSQNTTFDNQGFRVVSECPNAASAPKSPQCRAVLG